MPDINGTPLTLVRVKMCALDPMDRSGTKKDQEIPNFVQIQRSLLQNQPKLRMENCSNGLKTSKLENKENLQENSNNNSLSIAFPRSVESNNDADDHYNQKRAQILSSFTESTKASSKENFSDSRKSTEKFKNNQKEAQYPQNQLVTDKSSPALLEWKRAIDSVSMPNYSEPKCSMKSFGRIKGYSANTNQGPIRDYNEDRVSVILNIMKPHHRAHEHWPNCSFFAVYDGHGGSTCSDFLRDNLHNFIVQSTHFPWSPREALIEGMDKAERVFIERAHGSSGLFEVSGSCAIVVLVIGEVCHVANVGDSRAVLSMERGSKAVGVSRDHKPEDPIEKRRIVEFGGRVYQ